MTVSDGSPDALARLEAKRLGDLERVRKVRALLEEHGLAATGSGFKGRTIRPWSRWIGSHAAVASGVIESAGGEGWW